MQPLTILYEDNHLLVVDKPAGVATMGTEVGRPTVARQAAAYLKQKYSKPGNAFVGIVSRLDRLVSGVLVLAKTSKAASRISEQIRSRKVQKRYLACIETTDQSDDFPSNWKEIANWVSKSEKLQRMQVVPESAVGAKQAVLRLRQINKNASSTLLEVDLITGRKHQIRLQLSGLGYPILGDQKYGARRNYSPGIALHCHQLRIKHPTKDESLQFRSLPNHHWPQFLNSMLAKVEF